MCISVDPIRARTTQNYAVVSEAMCELRETQRLVKHSILWDVRRINLCTTVG
jgi:hypothetical protein